MHIKLIKLISGEELVSEIKYVRYEEDKMIVDNVDFDLILLVNPLQLIMQKPGQIGLIPFMPYAIEQTIRLMESSTSIVADPIEELVNEYKSAFSSIITPQKKVMVAH